MKKYLFIVLLVSIGFSQKSYNEEHLVEQNGIWYKKFSDEVVNGEVFKKIGDMEAPLGKMKDGKKNGKWMRWRRDGTKEGEEYYKNGKEDGRWTDYSSKGKPYYEKIYSDGSLKEMIRYYDDGSIQTSGKLKNDLPFEGSFMTMQSKKVDERLNLKWAFHTFYENGKPTMLIDINTDGDTISIEHIVDDKRKIIKVRDKESGTLIDYVDTSKNVERVLAFEEGLFKVYYKQRNAGGNNTIDLELENGYNVNYHSVWFMVTATKKSSNDPFSKRIAFYDVDKTSTAKASFIPYGNAVLKDIKLELTRQRRK